MAEKHTNNSTKSKILKLAIRLMLENGFEATTAQKIATAMGISKGNLTYHYPTKEHILFEMAKEITTFHKKSITDIMESGESKLTAYCWEVAAQIIICEEIPQARDLYLNIYSSPMTMSYVKDWTAQKNSEVLNEIKPNWQYDDFRTMVNVTCCIERSALTEICTEDYTIDKKISLTLDCLMKLYDVNKSDRETAIADVLKINKENFAHKIWHDFVAFAEQETNY